MAIEAHLDLIRQRFSKPESKIIVNSLRQDRLIWQCLTEDGSALTRFETAEPDLTAYTPASLALWLIEQQQGVELGDLTQWEAALPNEIKDQATQAFEATLNAGLPPADLATAGLLALALRERRKVKGNWEGIADEILLKRGASALQKNVRIWRTPFACLFHLCPDFDALIEDFFQTEAHSHTVIPLLVHATLANPAPAQDQLDDIVDAVKNTSIDLQLEALQSLNRFQRPALCKSLAQHLIGSKEVANFIASVFSELERFRTHVEDVDPLEKQVRFGLAEDINRLAALNHYAGQPEKTASLYRQSSEVLAFVQAQTLFQSAACAPHNTPQSDWEHVLRTLPGSQQARAHYIQVLIENGARSEAKTITQTLADGPEKTYFSRLLDEDAPAKTSQKERHDRSAPSQSQNTPTTTMGYWAHDPSFDINKAQLQAWLGESQPPAFRLPDEINYGDLTMVRAIRDWQAKVHEYDQAIELTSYLDLAEPENPDHFRTLAKLYGLTERWPQAYRTIQKIVKTEANPSGSDLLLFAESALRTGRPEMAISICQNILQQDDQNHKALILLGEGFWQQGDAPKAIQHMEKVVETIPTEAETWLALARIWMENGQPERALDVLQKGVLALPEHPDILRQLGQLHLEKQSPADALTFLKKAYDIDPDHVAGQLNLARAAYQLGHYPRAWGLLEPYMAQTDQDPEISRLLGKVLLAMDKGAQAKPILLRSAKHFPEDRETTLAAVQLALADAENTRDAVNVGELAQVRHLLSHSLQQTPEDFELQIGLADVERLSGNDSQAFQAYVRLAEDLPQGRAKGQWRLQYGMGKSALALGNLDVGLAALQEAVRIQPENIHSLQALAEAYLFAGLSNKAVETARTALNLAPQDVPNIIWFVRFQQDSHNPAEAIKALKQALIPTPHQPELKLWLAKTQISMGETEAAQEQIRDLIASSQPTAEELHQAAYLSVQTNQMDLAIQALEKASIIHKTFDPLLVMDLASAYGAQNHQRKALEVLNLSQERILAQPELALVKADLLDTLGQYDLALETLQNIEAVAEEGLSRNDQLTKRLRQSPLLYAIDFSLSAYYHRLGVFTLLSGDFARAQQYLEKALALSPDNTKIRLAFSQAHMLGMDYAKALKTLQEQDSNLATQDGLDLVCARSEALFYLDDPQAAIAAIESIPTGLTPHPRLIALRSRSAGWAGEPNVASDRLKEAVQAYQETPAPFGASAIQSVYPQVMTLLGIAEAASALGDLAQALDRLSQAIEKAGDLPHLSWRYASVLVQAALEQRMAQSLEITRHAPGERLLSQETFAQFQTHLAACQPFLSNQAGLCLKAAGVAVFEGHWPSDIDITACLNQPVTAAAILLASDSELTLRQALEVHPNHPQALHAAGIFALHHPLPDGVQLAQRALQAAPTDPARHALLAFLNRPEPEAALQSIQTALSFWPDEPRWHAYAADLNAQLGRTEAAAEHIDQALRVNPADATLWEKSAELKMRGNQLEFAKHDLEESLAHQSTNIAAWMKLADVNRKLGDLPEAIHTIQQAGKLAPDNPSVAIKEAQFLLDQDAFAEAIAKTKTLLASDASQDQARIIQAQAYAGQGQPEQALATLNEALEQDPDRISLRLAALKIKQTFHGTEETLPELIALAERHPEDAQVLILLTDWLIQTQRLEKAKTTAQTILRILPQEPQVHLMLGRLQRMNGQLDQAIAHLADALVIDPTMVEAYIELGKAYQDRRDLEQAIQIFQKGAEADATDPRPYFHAGMALKECKDYAGAEAMLKQAKRQAPEDANIIRQLGVVTAMNLINHLRETG